MPSMENQNSYQFIRESRRIRARMTMTEHHRGVEAHRPHTEAVRFKDWVGTGSYA